MSKNIIIAPSILSADFTRLGEAIEMLNKSEADWIHVDVMDGVFVPNISFGMPIISQVKKIAKKPLDVHLMIVDPDRYLETFQKCGADIITVHYEACNHLHRTISKIKELGMKAGVVLNPHTPVENLTDILPYLDLVLLMSVNPGFGGQRFIETTLAKTKRLREMAKKSQPNLIIEIDGGVDLNNISALVVAGADAFVAGNTVFGSANPTETISKLKNIK